MSSVRGTGEQARTESVRVRELRKRLGLSQEQLATRLGVSFVTVNRWETGRTGISASALRRLNELDGAAATDPGPPGAPPAAASSFVGREPEIAALTSLLSTARLLSLVGPGGAGKTRLALEVLGRVAGNGVPRVVFVPVGQISDAAGVPTRVAAALGIRDRPGEPATDALAGALSREPVLLVLDGAEHVLPGVAALVQRLLTHAPTVQIVVTSRTVLGVAGEQVWPVPVLPCPAPGAGLADTLASDAVALFAARAAERSPEFQVTPGLAGPVGELCRRLDGLPLAIELAAGWVGTLPIGQILDRRFDLLDAPGLGGSGDSGRTLRAVAESSAALLGEAERGVLRLLSVFAGWFTLADAEAVTGVPAARLPHHLRGLVDSSWLVTVFDGDQGCYRMLDTLREYAAAELAAAGQAHQARGRHARHFAGLAAASEQGLTGASRAHWVARMERATANIEAALSWAQSTGEDAIGLEMAAALWRWWLTTGRLVEGRRWLRVFIDRAGDARQHVAVAKASWAAGVLANENGDYRAGIAMGTRALRAASALGAVDLAAKAATALGAGHRYLGDHATACRYFEQAVTHQRKSGDEAGLAAALNNVAVTAIDVGDLNRAQRLCEESLALKRSLSDPRSLAVGLVNLADILIKTGQDGLAEEVVAEAGTLVAGLGDVQLSGLITCTSGDLERSRGNYTRACEEYQRSLDCFRTAGTVHDTILALCGLGVCQHHLGNQADGAKLLREAESLAIGAASGNRMPEVRSALAEAGLQALGGPPGDLTARQAEILAHVATGLTNKAIADRLHLSASTVERHLATVYRKLGLRNRAQATRYALRHGLSPPAGR
jgi:predicted ATPase/DNA-binding CsgD family transcriptional regulator